MAGEQRISIDISNYLKQKEEGTARIIKVNGIAHYAVRKFNGDTGEPIPELVKLDRKQAEEQRQFHQGIIATLDAVIADIDAATEV